MKPTVILFDCDGVMIHEPYLFTQQLARDYGLDASKTLPFFTGVFRQCALGEADLKEELAKVTGDWGWQGTVDELLAYWFSVGTKIDDAMVAFVRELTAAGYRCFMTTDQEKYRGEHLRATLGGGTVFEQVFYSADLRMSKKTEAYFAHVYDTICAGAAAIPKKEFLLIDDSEKVIEVAKAFGFDTYFFGPFEPLKEMLLSV